MNVGVFTNAYKPIVSGVVNAVEFIKEGLSRRGHQVFIFAPGFRGHKDDNSHIFRFRSLNLLKKLEFPFAVPYSNRIRKFLEGIHLDLLHSQHPFLLGVYASRLSRRLRIPLIYTFHTQYEQYAHYVPLGINQAFIRKVTRSLVCGYARHCHLILTPAPSIKELLRSYGITTPIEVIPNAIDLAPFQKLDPTLVREKYQLHGKRVLIFVGRMAREKNLEFLLEAFQTVVHKIPATVLLLIGGGPHQEQLEDRVQRLGLQGQVIFTGFVPYDLVPSYMAAGDLFVMSSVSEVKPLAILEAMAAGLPVVAVRAPGAMDTVTDGENGWLTALSQDEFAEVIVGVLQQETLRKHASMGARETAPQYSLDVVIERLAEVYRRVLKHYRASK